MLPAGISDVTRRALLFAKTREGYAVAAATVLLAVLYRYRNMIQDYEWFMYRYFDQKVENYLRESVSDEIPTMNGPRRWSIPRSREDISRATGFSGKRVSACLKRLSRKRLAVADGEMWKRGE